MGYTFRVQGSRNLYLYTPHDITSTQNTIRQIHKNNNKLTNYKVLFKKAIACSFCIWADWTCGLREAAWTQSWEDGRGQLRSALLRLHSSALLCLVLKIITCQSIWEPWCNPAYDARKNDIELSLTDIHIQSVLGCLTRVDEIFQFQIQWVVSSMIICLELVDFSFIKRSNYWTYR